jgi:protein SCO1/2
MFTGCSTTCPPQGLLFSTLSARTRPFATRWLSISIDALGDDAPALQAWLKRHGAGPAWRAAVPSVAGAESLLDFVRGREPGPDRHTAQVYFFTPRGELALRSTDFPSASQVVAWLQALPHRG